MNCMKTHLIPQRVRDKGLVLVVGLMFIMVLAAVGSVAYLTTSGDLLVSRNYRQHVEAGFVAEAAMQEARARLGLNISDAAVIQGGQNVDWWVYIVSGGAVTPPDDSAPWKPDNPAPVVIASSQNDMEYMVRIRYKRERDAELLGHTTITPHYADNDEVLSTAPGSMKPANAPGNVIHLDSGGQHTTNPAPNPSTAVSPASAVYVITAFARAGGADGPLVTREIEVARLPGGEVDVIGALYVEGDVSLSGTPGVNSTDGSGGRGLWCGNPSAPGIPAIYMHGALSTQGVPWAKNVIAPNPYNTNLPHSAVIENGTVDLDLLATIQSMQGRAGIVVNGGNFATGFGAQNDYVVVLSTGDIHLTGNGQSYGVLIALGNVFMSGTHDWHGLVLTLGDFHIVGTSNVYGAVMAGGESSASNGTPRIFYNSCDVQMALDALSPDTHFVLAWRDLGMMED